MPERVGKCLLCGSTEGHVFERAIKQLDLLPPFSVIECARCGTGRLDPRPTADEYRVLYNADYFGLSDTVAANGHAWLRDYPPAQQSYAAATLLSRETIWAERLERLERTLGRRGRILDIGASTGRFVEQARQRGWEVAGVELSEQARAEAKRQFGIDLIGQTLEELSASATGAEYDAIHMSHVLEHVPDPAQALRDLRRLLRPGGVLYIEVPNQFDAWVNKVFAAVTRAPTPARSSFSIHHTHFFRAEPLAACVRRCGLDVVRVTTHIPTSFQTGRLRRRLVSRAIDLIGDRVSRSGLNIEIIARHDGKP